MTTAPPFVIIIQQTAIIIQQKSKDLIRRGSEYPLTDGQGTTKLETNSSQTITGTQETEAFGRGVGATGSTASPFGYHGSEGYRQDGDGPAGLEPYQKVGARYYDATFGRFITRDTDLSQAPYAYCDGDPVNCSDPSGHDDVAAIPNTSPQIGPTPEQQQQYWKQVEQQLDQEINQEFSGLAGGSGGGAASGAGASGTPGAGGGGQKSTGTTTYKLTITLPSPAMPHKTVDFVYMPSDGLGGELTTLDGALNKIVVIYTKKSK